MKNDSSVLLIFTGGTISMGENPATQSLSPLDSAQVLSFIPELKMLRVNISRYRSIHLSIRRIFSQNRGCVSLKLFATITTLLMVLWYYMEQTPWLIRRQPSPI